MPYTMYITKVVITFYALIYYIYINCHKEDFRGSGAEDGWKNIFRDQEQN